MKIKDYYLKCIDIKSQEIFKWNLAEEQEITGQWNKKARNDLSKEQDLKLFSFLFPDSYLLSLSASLGPDLQTQRIKNNSQEEKSQLANENGK